MTKLDLYRAAIRSTWASWRDANRAGSVLTRDTAVSRFGDANGANETST